MLHKVFTQPFIGRVASQSKHVMLLSCQDAVINLNDHKRLQCQRIIPLHATTSYNITLIFPQQYNFSCKQVASHSFTQKLCDVNICLN